MCLVVTLKMTMDEVRKLTHFALFLSRRKPSSPKSSEAEAFLRVLMQATTLDIIFWLTSGGSNINETNTT